MNTMEMIRNYFGAALPIVALDSPSAEEKTTLEKLYLEVGRRLKLPVYAYDIAAGLRQIAPAEELIYRLPDGTVWDGEVVEERGALLTPDREELTVERQGASGIDFKPISTSFKHAVLGIFQHIESAPKGGIYVLVDFHPFLDGDRVIPEAKRYLKHLATALKQSHKRIVLLGQDIRLGPDYSGLVYEVSSRLPELVELQEAVNICIADMQQEMQGKRFTTDLSEGTVEAIVTACRGLTIEESLNALRIDMRARKRVDVLTAHAITQFKIAKLEKLNIRFSPPPDVAPGGVQEFKNWVVQRKRLFNAAINQQPTRLKLPTPRGCLIVGPSGTGKSLLAKTLGTLWNVPILQVDIGSFYSSLVGETEANFRRFTRLVDNLGPVVILFDEIEKGLGGVAGGAASTDSGVSQRLFGAMLTWMNDKTSPCFVVATANNIEGLPSEFKRKGRFDEIWFVDTPNADERHEILAVHLSKHQVQLPQQEMTSLVTLTDEFVGAEIRQVVDEAAILAAEQGLDTIEASHVEAAIAVTVPLARSQADVLANLRQWADTAARNASPKVEALTPVAVPNGRRSKPHLLLEDE